MALVSWITEVISSISLQYQNPSNLHNTYIFQTIYYHSAVMYRMQTSLVAALAVVAAAVPTDVIDRSLTARATADFYNMIDLDQFESNSSNGTLDKRIDYA